MSKFLFVVLTLRGKFGPVGPMDFGRPGSPERYFCGAAAAQTDSGQRRQFKCKLTHYSLLITSQGGGL
ncbi:MAG: hypothetical protein QGG53_23185 [Planctomycetota bacterium]|jgi:hypothetical protein|nr:hypothetical protein [Planctomycetota bacterium]